MEQKLIFLFVCLVFGFRTKAVDLKIDKTSSARAGKLFFISTSSTTTIATTTICFRSGTAVAVCKKKKRSIQQDPFDDEDNKIIEPTLSRVDDSHSLENDREAVVESGVRAGRFAVYWKTTTITSTSTSYSSTSTLASLKCTPNDFVISACP